MKSLRKERSLTQEQLAEKSGLDFTYLNEIENGKRNPTLETINKICGGLGVPMWEFFLGMENYKFLPNDVALEALIQDLHGKELVKKKK